MDPDTAASAPEISAPKILAPAPKPHRMGAAEVFELLQVPYRRRIAVHSVARKVYAAHLQEIDVAFEKIPTELMKAAIDELKEKLPEEFKLCEGDWFGLWLIHCRHRGRFRGSKKGNDPEGTSASVGNEARGDEEEK